jgi:hypothetical protein
VRGEPLTLFELEGEWGRSGGPEVDDSGAVRETNVWWEIDQTSKPPG